MRQITELLNEIQRVQSGDSCRLRSRSGLHGGIGSGRVQTGTRSRRQNDLLADVRRGGGVLAGEVTIERFITGIGEVKFGDDIESMMLHGQRNVRAGTSRQ